jgi:glycogen debranching enzyme
VEGGDPPPLQGCRAFASTDDPHDRRRDRFLEESTSFATRESETLAPVVVGAAEQARRDLASLRLPDLDQGEREWTMAAGVPIYVALFGRDTLTAAWQAALLGPEMMRGTLEVLARLQGRETNDWRDEQPGRMLHEAHTGPLAALDLHPRRRYYGSATTSGFYPVIVSELWHWTGDADVVRRFVRPALDALAWLDRDSDRDGDGFYEYRTRSSQGVTNQGWKDSGDAIRYGDGRVAVAPLALCEVQGYAYAALRARAAIAERLGDDATADRCNARAGVLKERFNREFWLPDRGWYAVALGPDKEPVDSLTSNIGQCLWTGIVDDARAEEVAKALLSPAMWTGWGIRTLAADERGFDPMSYHCGSVWPHDNALCAAGLARYGFMEAAVTVINGLLDASEAWNGRLPEFFCGLDRDDVATPIPMPTSCSPQAWSSASPLLLLRLLLGLEPDAAGLVVSPMSSGVEHVWVRGIDCCDRLYDVRGGESEGVVRVR